MDAAAVAIHIRASERIIRSVFSAVLLPWPSAHGIELTLAEVWAP